MIIFWAELKFEIQISVWGSVPKLDVIQLETRQTKAATSTKKQTALPNDQG